MRRMFERAGAPAVVVGLTLVAGSAMADELQPNIVPATIVAVVDRARLVKVPSGSTTLIIGNPTIADVTMLQQKDLMVLTPKAFGETNFIAIDKDGNPLAESTIRVVAGPRALVVQRGMDRQSYSCEPVCQPTERLGDDDKYLSQVATQDIAHNARLSNAQAPTAITTPATH